MPGYWGIGGGTPPTVLKMLWLGSQRLAVFWQGVHARPFGFSARGIWGIRPSRVGAFGAFRMFWNPVSKIFWGLGCFGNRDSKSPEAVPGYEPVLRHGRRMKNKEQTRSNYQLKHKPLMQRCQGRALPLGVRAHLWPRYPTVFWSVGNSVKFRQSCGRGAPSRLAVWAELSTGSVLHASPVSSAAFTVLAMLVGAAHPRVLHGALT
jgi:hypothetical protein